MAIVLTENAATHITTMLEKRGHGLGLRLGTRKSGCSGFAYVVDYVDQISNDDIVFESRGVKVVVNKQNLEQLDGIEIDYLKANGLKEEFMFRNPKVKEMCGCGESFSI